MDDLFVLSPASPLANRPSCAPASVPAELPESWWSSLNYPAPVPAEVVLGPSSVFEVALMDSTSKTEEEEATRNRQLAEFETVVLQGVAPTQTGRHVHEADQKRVLTRSLSEGRSGVGPPTTLDNLQLAVPFGVSLSGKPVQLGQEASRNRSWNPCFERDELAQSDCGRHSQTWTKNEDVMLRQLMEQFQKLYPGGAVRWAKIAQHVSNRTPKQIRERWLHHLDPTIKHGPWDPEEDAMLLAMRQVHGNSWAAISASIPGRPDNSVKNRWNSHLSGLRGKAASRKRATQNAQKNNDNNGIPEASSFQLAGPALR